MQKTRDIVSDDAVETVHGNANFGPQPKRDVLDEGVLKYALGYTSGYTQLAILLEHGLVRKPAPGSYKSALTMKGRAYARAMFDRPVIERLMALRATP